MKNDNRPSAGRIAQQAIFESMVARTAPTCPCCGQPTRTGVLPSHPGFAGYRCRPCGWESAPVATLGANGELVMVAGSSQAGGAL